MISVKREINYSWWLLRVMFGVTFLFAGGDKFAGAVTDWGQFLVPLRALSENMPLSRLLYFSGIIELTLGVLLFTRWVAVASLLVVVWMFLNGVYLMVYGIFLDTAFRYCSLGICALVLFLLTRVRYKIMRM